MVKRTFWLEVNRDGSRSGPFAGGPGAPGLGWHADLKKLAARVSKGHLQNADKVMEQIGRLRERWPAASKFAPVEVIRGDGGAATRVTWRYDRAKLRAALGRDGAYLLLSDQTDWTAEQLWATYMQRNCLAGRRPVSAGAFTVCAQAPR